LLRLEPGDKHVAGGGANGTAFVLAQVSLLTAVVWPPVSDAGRESAGRAAAALVLAGFGRLASTRRIERRPWSVRGWLARFPRDEGCEWGRLDAWPAPDAGVPLGD
jgi:hypothetical protein